MMYRVEYTQSNGEIRSYVHQTYWNATMHAKAVKENDGVSVRIYGDGDLGPVDTVDEAINADLRWDEDDA